MLDQVAATISGNVSLASLADTSSGYWPQAITSIGGLNGGLESIYTGITGVDSGIGIVNSSLGGLNGGLNSVNSSIGGLNGGISSVNSSVGSLHGGLSSVNASVSGLNDGLSSIYSALVDLAAGNDITISGKYEGSTTSYRGTSSGAYGGSTTSYGGTTTSYSGSTGSYGGTTGTTSSYDEYEKVAMGSGIYGSTFKTERALLTAKTRHMNLTKYNGRNDWTIDLVKQTIVDAVRAESPKTATSQAVKYWYEHGGKYEQQWGYYAKGGITPTDRPFVVGEKGPELMVSAQQYGVLSNEASKALLSNNESGGSKDASDAEILEGIREGLALLAGYMRQVVVKTDKSAWLCEGIRNILREWNEVGMPKEADA